MVDDEDNLYNAIAMLVYQTRDNTDEKQAQRVQSSSPLGLLFDHGYDAINSIIGSANRIIGMRFSMTSTLTTTNTTNNKSDNDDNDDDYCQIFRSQCWMLVFGSFAMLYVARWGQY